MATCPSCGSFYPDGTLHFCPPSADLSFDDGDGPVPCVEDEPGGDSKEPVVEDDGAGDEEEEEEVWDADPDEWNDLDLASLDYDQEEKKEKKPGGGPKGPLPPLFCGAHPASVGVHTPVPIPHEFRLLTWNIQNFTRDFRGKGRQGWGSQTKAEARSRFIAHVMHRIDADMLCVLETGSDVSGAMELVEKARRQMAGTSPSPRCPGVGYEALVTDLTFATPATSQTVWVTQAARHAAPTAVTDLALLAQVFDLDVGPSTEEPSAARALAAAFPPSPSPAGLGGVDRKVSSPAPKALSLSSIVANGQRTARKQLEGLLASELGKHPVLRDFLNDTFDALNLMLDKPEELDSLRELRYLSALCRTFARGDMTVRVPAWMELLGALEALELAHSFALIENYGHDPAFLIDQAGVEKFEEQRISVICLLELYQRIVLTSPGPISSLVEHPNWTAINQALTRLGCGHPGLKAESYGILYRPPPETSLEKFLGANTDKIYYLVKKQESGLLVATQDPQKAENRRTFLHIPVPIGPGQVECMCFFHGPFTGPPQKKKKAVKDADLRKKRTRFTRKKQTRQAKEAEKAKKAAAADRKDAGPTQLATTIRMRCDAALAMADWAGKAIPVPGLTLCGDWNIPEDPGGDVTAVLDKFHSTMASVYDRKGDVTPTTLKACGSISAGADIYSQPYDVVYVRKGRPGVGVEFLAVAAMFEGIDFTRPEWQIFKNAYRAHYKGIINGVHARFEQFKKNLPLSQKEMELFKAKVTSAHEIIRAVLDGNADLFHSMPVREPAPHNYNDLVPVVAALEADAAAARAKKNSDWTRLAARIEELVETLRDAVIRLAFLAAHPERRMAIAYRLIVSDHIPSLTKYAPPKPAGSFGPSGDKKDDGCIIA